MIAKPSLAVPSCIAGLLLLIGCGDGTLAPGGDARLIIVGYHEVGYSLGARIVRGTDTSAVATSALRFGSSDPVSVSSSGGFVYSATGTFTIGTTLEAGTTLSTTITIGPPPTIVFDMVAGGNRDIYRATIYGNDLLRLTTDPAVDVHPTAAKNTLTFTSYRDGNGELYSRPLSVATPEMRLTTTPANETDAELSPDGARMAYTRDDGGIPRVWVADASGANASALTNTTGSTIEGSPTWRFASDSLLIMSTLAGNASIFRVSRLPASTPSSTVKPATGDSVYVEPAWSPDGKSIAYTAAMTGGTSRIALRNRAANTATFLTPATISAGQPVFLADGRIVFTIFGANGSTSLAWVDPSTSAGIFPIQLTGTDPQHPAIIWP